MDIDTVTLGIMRVLDILNKEEQSIDIDDSHMTQIKEYLTLLDLIMEIDLESLPEVDKKVQLLLLLSLECVMHRLMQLWEICFLTEDFRSFLSKKDTVY